MVPHAAEWRLSSIPDPVPAGTIETLFGSLDSRSPKGLRDRAILLLPTGLGLRACEIAGLRLDDIGWQTGSLRVHGKGDRADELPLPDEVGKALEDYVLNGRGGLVDGDEVFWTVIAPVQPLTANGVCGAVRQLCVNAGVTKFGPHRLRQTFASSAGVHRRPSAGRASQRRRTDAGRRRRAYWRDKGRVSQIEWGGVSTIDVIHATCRPSWAAADRSDLGDKH